MMICKNCKQEIKIHDDKYCPCKGKKYIHTETLFHYFYRDKRRDIAELE